MATTFTFPSSVALRETERVLLPRLTQARPIFEILPLRDLDSYAMEYTQRGIITGLQQVRGLGGDPRRVKEIGAVVKYVEPGVYGEFRLINEVALTARRAWGATDFSQMISIDDLVMDASEQLLERQLDRQEQLGWNTLIYGTFTALGEQGQVLHTDTYSIQNFTAGIPWATQATSFPLGNMRQVQVLSRGMSVNFGAESKLYMNRVTSNSWLANTNASDFGGKKANYGSSITSIVGVNAILTGEDLPQVVVYDRGYVDESNNFQLFIPNGRAVLVGRRDSGTPIGNTQQVRNANNPSMEPGAYYKVIDRGENTVPRAIEVHRGFSGGPVLIHPEAIVSLNVA